MKYSRFSEDQERKRNQERQPLPKGDYPFIIKAVEDKPTKSGRYNMLVLDLELHLDDGRTKKQKDWVVYDMEEMAWKLRHLAATTGLLEEYESNTLTPGDLLEKHGVARLTTQEYADSDGELTISNAVKDYVKPGEAKGVSPIKSGLPEDAPFNDDLPL